MKNLAYQDIIKENITIILTFVFSRERLQEISNDRTLGEWKFLGDAVSEATLARAERAALELGILFRLLDDKYKIPNYFKDKKTIVFGLISGGSESGQHLSAREMSNKIVHAQDLKWDTRSSKEPKLICISNQPDRWQSAEIDVLKLALLCSQLMR